MEIPRIISVDNHVIEPAHVWQQYLPAAFRDAGPRLIRVKGRLRFEPRHMAFREDPDGYWADCWSYAGLLFPVTGGFAAVSFPREAAHNRAVLFEDILPGCFDRAARLADMDRTTPRRRCVSRLCRASAGRPSSSARTRELALACVRTYNDWMIDEWCAGEASGRLIPLTIIPMWDADLAAPEIRRCAAQGVACHRFSESTTPSGCRACTPAPGSRCRRLRRDRDRGQHAHRLVVGAADDIADAPRSCSSPSPSRAPCTPWSTGCCGRPFEAPGPKIAFSEGQVGWMPFILQRLDDVWERAEMYEGEESGAVPDLPSSYVPGGSSAASSTTPTAWRSGIASGWARSCSRLTTRTGTRRSPFPRTSRRRSSSKAGLSEQEIWQLVRGNAIACYGLDRYGITH